MICVSFSSCQQQDGPPIWARHPPLLGCQAASFCEEQPCLTEYKWSEVGQCQQYLLILLQEPGKEDKNVINFWGFILVWYCFILILILKDNPPAPKDLAVLTLFLYCLFTLMCWCAQVRVLFVSYRPTRVGHTFTRSMHDKKYKFPLFVPSSQLSWSDRRRQIKQQHL